MLKRLSNRQLEKLLFHTAEINHVLVKACLPAADAGLEWDTDAGEHSGMFITESGVEDRPYRETARQSFIADFDESDRRRKEEDLSRLCGRWTAGNNRCGVEISRAGEHFILTCLKRSGYPSDERYVLIWMDGDIFYYGQQDRITVLALNTRSDTLMISPGADYTRTPENEKK